MLIGRIYMDGKKHPLWDLRDNVYEFVDAIRDMEDINISYMKRIVGADPDNKIHKLLDYTERGGNIADPWYSGDFTTTYNDILEGLEGFLKSQNL